MEGLPQKLTMVMRRRLKEKQEAEGKQVIKKGKSKTNGRASVLLVGTLQHLTLHVGR